MIDFFWDAAFPFTEGLAAVKHPSLDKVDFYDMRGFGDSWGYIDKTGKVVIIPHFESPGGFSNGRAEVIPLRT